MHSKSKEHGFSSPQGMSSTKLGLAQAQATSVREGSSDSVGLGLAIGED